MPHTVDKLIHISDAYAQRLKRLAHAQGTTEDALIVEALTILFGLRDLEDEAEEHTAWSALSLNAFARVWENDADAVYDNWKELYGLSER